MQHTPVKHASTSKSMRSKHMFTLKAGVAIAAIVLLVMVISITARTPDAYAVTAAEKQAEAEEVLANLNSMQETLDRLSDEYGEAVLAQQEAEGKRDEAEKQINDLNKEIDSVQGQLNERAREMYRTGNVTFLDMVLGANSFEEFATSLDMANKVNQSEADLIDQQRDLKAQAEEQASIYDEQAAIAEQKSKEAEAAAEQAQATVAEMQATYDSLSAEAAELLEEERKAREAEEAARAAAIVAESAARAQAEAEAAAANNGGGNNGDNGDNGGNGGGNTATYDADSDSTAVVSEGSSYEGGNDTVSRAYACLGAPYVWGGVGPDGYDCSGLVSYCLSGEHIRLGTTLTFMGWEQVSDPQPGDICVNSGHTGIYIGGGQMIHAADYGIGVIIGPVQSGMIIVRY